MRTFLDTLYRCSGWFAAACIAGICLLVVSQVSLNLIDRISTLITGSAIGLTIPSYADFTGFLLAAASFMALAHSLKEGAHIRVTLLLGRLPRWMRTPVEIWCLALALAITAYFTWYTGGLTWESWVYNDLSSGMVAVPIWIPQLGMLVGLGILTVAIADELVCVLLGASPSYESNADGLLEQRAEPGVDGGGNE